MSLAAGTVLWREPKTVATSGAAQNIRAVLPADCTSSHTVFAGVVCRDGEPETGRITVAVGGTALALVTGEVAAGDAVYQVIGQGYTSSIQTPATTLVGTALEAVAVGQTKLIKVALNPYGAAGASVGGVPASWMEIRTLELIGGIMVPKHRRFLCTEYY